MNIAARKCKVCGEEFIPNSCYQMYCKRPHYRICPVCGKSYVETNLGKFKRPPTACSQKCKFKRVRKTSMEKYGVPAPGNNPSAREKSKKTMQERYGVDYAQSSKEIRKKSIATFMDKYGVDNPQKNAEIKNKTKNTNMQKYGSECYLNSEEGKAKISKTMLDRYGTTTPLRNKKINENWKYTNIQKYGVDNPAKSEEVRQKMKETSLMKYGTEYPMSSDIVKQRIKDTFIRNYGVDNCFKSEEIIAKIKQSFWNKYHAHGPLAVEEIASKIRKTNMQKYGVPYYIMLPNISKSSGRISKINEEIAEKIRKLDIQVRMEYSIGKHSYDLYIPQAQLLIEVDPSYTHSTAGNHWNNAGIDKNYHLQKTIFAEEHGYRCVHLWDWDCVSKFINSLTIKNIIYESIEPLVLDRDDAERFVHTYSLYNIDKMDNIIYIGIKYKSKLINVIGFRQRDTITNEWEIVCIECRFNYTVYNANSSILAFFIKQFNPTKITAYADYSKSNGEILESLGFEYNRFILPNKIWSKGHHAIVDDNITSEIMIEDHWLPVYNCGYKVYEK